MTHSDRLNAVNLTLTEAIKDKNKKGILAAYDFAEQVQFDHVTKDMADKYDALVDQGNEILYS